MNIGIAMTKPRMRGTREESEEVFAFPLNFNRDHWVSTRRNNGAKGNNISERPLPKKKSSKLKFKKSLSDMRVLSKSKHMKITKRFRACIKREARAIKQTENSRIDNKRKILTDDFLLYKFS